MGIDTHLDQLDDINESIQSMASDFNGSLARIAQELAILNKHLVNIDGNLYMIGSAK